MDAYSEQARGLLSSSWQQMANPLGSAAEYSWSTLEAAWEGYEENGLWGAVNAVSLLAMARGGSKGGGVRRGAGPPRTFLLSPSARANLRLVQSIATRAERAISDRYKGLKEPMAGTLKHTYARDLLERYQNRYGHRGLYSESSWKNQRKAEYAEDGSIRIDVLDKKNVSVHPVRQRTCALKGGAASIPSPSGRGSG